jgi:predicted unusual protein kinase regulating ubiquinone biosynthesis (AarF/ABC1/UbiB family)
VLAPEEYVEQMSNLYQKAKESPFEDVKQQIESNTGKKIEDLFSCNLAIS